MPAPCSTFLRRLETLNYLRKRAEPASTEDIAQHLLFAGYLDETLQGKSRLRVVQRDLKELLGECDEAGEFSNEFGLSMTRGLGKSLHWQLDPYEQRQYDFEKMPAFMALTLSVSQKHLRQVLPANTQSELERVFQEAESKLHKSEGAAVPLRYHKLKDAVEFYQRGQSLQPPDFDVANLDAIYRAILTGKRLQFSYRSGARSKDYDVHPFGVAIMLPKLYLVAVKHEHIAQVSEGTPHYRSFLIHKIDAAFVGKQSNRVPASFSMKAYLAAGHMDVLVDSQDRQRYQLRLLIKPSASAKLLADLRESPVAEDQKIRAQDDGSFLLTASVRRTVQLRNWLISLGADCKVLAPNRLVEDLVHSLSGMLQAYRGEDERSC